MAPVFDFSETYSDGTTLTKAQLTALVDSIETALNTTGLDSTNIQSGGVATTNLAAASVTASKLASDSVTTAKILDANVTRAKLEAAAQVPTGVMLPYGGTSAPTGFLLCDGSAVSRTTYADLYAVIGDAYGHGNGTTTFNVPDSRGRFLRFTDSGAGNDPDAASRTAMATGGNTGDNVGSVQADDYASHTHSVPGYYGSVNGFFGFVDADNHGLGTYPTNASGGNETRPKNFGANLIIKT